MLSSYSLISAREHCLSLPVVENFCRYFALYLLGKNFDPAYTTETRRPRVNYCFVNLEDAYEQYLLEPENVAFFERIEKMRPLLQEALKAKDSVRLHQLILDVMPSRLIVKNNAQWLQDHEDELANLVSFACEQFSDESPDYDAFGRQYGPRMSSFLSRLYSIILLNSITFDSRVAAGLELFIREFCLTHKIDLPEELRLVRLQGWGKDKKENGRNASWGNNNFPPIDKIKKRPLKERSYAKSNITASWLVNESIRLARLSPSCPDWIKSDRALRNVEASLYMMGARLPVYREGEATF